MNTALREAEDSVLRARSAIADSILSVVWPAFDWPDPVRDALEKYELAVEECRVIKWKRFAKNCPLAAAIVRNRRDFE